jgi:hypothetical protein
VAKTAMNETMVIGLASVSTNTEAKARQMPAASGKLVAAPAGRGAHQANAHPAEKNSATDRQRRGEGDEESGDCRQAEGADGTIDAVGQGRPEAAGETDAGAVRQGALNTQQADRPDRRGNRQPDQSRLEKQESIHFATPGQHV